MEIPDEILLQWRKLKDRNDTKLISDLAVEKEIDASVQVVRTMLREGTCSKDLFDVAAKFFEEKAATLKMHASRISTSITSPIAANTR